MRVIRAAANGWRLFWLGLGGRSMGGRLATRLASIGIRPYRGRHVLGRLSPKGYFAPNAEVVDVDLRLGKHVFVGERVLLARWGRSPARSSSSTNERQRDSGYVELSDHVHINRETNLEVLDGGAIKVGARTSIQTRCLLLSAVEPILIGTHVQIAPLCALFSYDHGMAAGELIAKQPLFSRGPIVIEDDVWLGVGVTVLSGVTIGRGAVIGAGSVVTSDIPAGAIAAGSPARVIKYRH
jgi:acetyltransferase-like isoleucine patch superfamily enzyme